MEKHEAAILSFAPGAIDRFRLSPSRLLILSISSIVPPSSYRVVMALSLVVFFIVIDSPKCTANLFSVRSARMSWPCLRSVVTIFDIVECSGKRTFLSIEMFAIRIK
jgi:hypothetical protein